MLRGFITGCDPLAALEGAGARCCSAQSISNSLSHIFPGFLLLGLLSFEVMKLLDGCLLLVLLQCQVPLSKAQGQPRTGEEEGLKGAKAEVKNQQR